MNALLYTLSLDGGGFMATAGRALNLMGSMELAVQGIQRAAGAMASAFNKAADMESVQTAIGTITKSATATAQVMADLKRDAASTPFEMSDLAPAARALLGAGTATKDVSKQLRMLGDIASGADTDLQGLVAVFNQVRGKGKLSAEEFQQFAERGVAGLREEIAKFKGIELNGVSDALSKGAVSAADFERILQRMTGSGGVFFQAMERQAQTFSGKLSTLSDAWASLQVAFAAPINEALKPLIDDAAGLAETLEPAFGLIGEQMAAVVSSARDFIGQIENGSGLVDALASSFGDLFATLGELVSIPFGALGDAIPSLVSAFVSAVGPLAEWLGLKFEVVAGRFASQVQSKLAEAMRGLDELLPDFGILSRAADFMDKGAMTDAMGAMRKDEALKGVDLGSGLNRSEASLNEGMQALIDGLTSRFEAFQVGAGLPTASEKAAAAQDAATANEPDFLGGMMAEAATAALMDRIAALPMRAADSATAAAPSRAETPPEAAATANATAAALPLLQEIRQQLERITTQ